MDKLKKQIVELREKGLPIKAICSHLKISQNTVKQFLGSEHYTKHAISYMNTFRKRREDFMSMDSVNSEALTLDRARLYAALLYWCEGSKYPASTSMSFTSTDIEMLKMFLFFLRNGFELKEEKFRIYLQFHQGQNRTEIFKFWSKGLGIPQTQFIKPSVTVKKGGRYRKEYWGTCSVRYNDQSIILRLMGIYKRFYKQTLASVI